MQPVDTGNDGRYDKFVHALVHEIRAPLVNINTAVEIIKATTKSEDLKLSTDIITKNLERINNLIDELFANGHTNGVHPEEYSIQKLLDEVLDMCMDIIRVKNITVTREYSEEDCVLILDRAKMKIALANIITNAIEAITEKGELRLVTRAADGKYELLVEDNGCGISKLNLKYIFKDCKTSKPGSLGLGLATIHHFLESNLIGVNIESGEGEGTRFSLSFNRIHTV